MDLVRRGFRLNPDWLVWAARSRLVNSRREAWQALGFAACGTPMTDYAEWHGRLARPIEPDGLDAPRSDWRRGPVFRLLMRLRGDHDPVRFDGTIRSLRRQVYPGWSVCAISDATTSAASLAAFRRLVADDARFSQPPLNDKCGFNADDFVALINIGDQLPDYALAVIAEVVSPEPELEFIYTDEDCITLHGDLQYPVLKPNWSPVLQRYAGYISRFALFRSRRLDHDGLRSLVSNEESAIKRFTKDVPAPIVRHICRILYSRGAATADTARGPAPRGHPLEAEPVQWPEVAVVIPTRDNAGLLAECLEGLRNRTDYPSVETIIIDNGSSHPAAVQLLQQIATVRRTTVLQRPGPFNYAALSNAGARATKAPVLLFLNNDIAMLQRNWLKAMVRWAIEPQVGVVGAKLLFPNGRIQHAGVVLGFGGDCRPHLPTFAAGLPWLSSATHGATRSQRGNGSLHGGSADKNSRQSAVLTARTWRSISTTSISVCASLNAVGPMFGPRKTTLTHHQSATRGIDRDPFALYRKERAYFVERWSHVIRDDPYFHPALSLYAHDVALA